MKKVSPVIAAMLVAISLVGAVTQMPAANACPRHDQINLNNQVRDLRQDILSTEEKISGSGGLIDQANLAKEIPNTMPRQWEAVEPDHTQVQLMLYEIASQLQNVQRISSERKYSAKTPNSVKKAFQSLDARLLKTRVLLKAMQAECTPGNCRNALNSSAFTLHKQVRQMEKLSLDILDGTLGKGLGL